MARRGCGYLTGIVLAVLTGGGVASAQSATDTTAKPDPYFPARTDTAASASRTDPTYSDALVDIPARELPGHAYPWIPERLGPLAKGCVVVQFVIDTTGRVAPETVLVLKSSDTLFSAAVLKVIPLLRFAPAVRDGRTVRELLIRPYFFNTPPGRRLAC